MLLSCSFSPSSGPEIHEPAHPSISPVCMYVCVCVCMHTWTRPRYGHNSQKPQGVSTELNASHMVGRREWLPSEPSAMQEDPKKPFCGGTKTSMLLLSRRYPELDRKDSQISSPLTIYACACTWIGLPWEGHVSRLGCVDRRDHILGTMGYLTSVY